MAPPPDDPTVALSEFEARNRAGESLIVFQGGVYDVTKWKKFHPGGELVVDHLKGKNATDVLIAWHTEAILKSRLPKFYIGKLVDDSEDSGKELSGPEAEGGAEKPRQRKKTVADVPRGTLTSVERAGGSTGYGPVSSDNEVSADYRRLHARLMELGFFETDMSNYVIEALKVVVLGAIVIYSGVFAPRHMASYLVAAVAQGILWQQLAFVGHDLGHNAVFRDIKKDYLMGTLVGNAILGISIGWWKKSHNVHHTVTNSPEDDSDIQHLPFFATSERFLSPFYSSYQKETFTPNAPTNFLLSLQDKIYFPFMAFAHFFLYLQGIIYVLGEKVPHRAWEVATFSCFFLHQALLMSYFHSWTGIVAYLLLSNGLAMVLHLQINVSHWSMDTAPSPENEDWATKAFRTTLDVECPEWLDWFHGGLQFQVEHHLFPRIARHKLRRVRPYVAEFAAKHGLQLYAQTFTDGNIRTIRGLKQVADQVGFAWGRAGGQKADMAEKATTKVQ